MMQANTNKDSGLKKRSQKQIKDPHTSAAEERFFTYKIAELNVTIRGGGKIVTEQGAPYRSESSAPPDITINLSKEFLVNLQKKYDYIPVDKWAHETTGLLFYKSLVDFDGFMLHASAVVLDGKAYLFSAPSGTGKSTHASLWLKNFGSARAYIVNDDKPAIRKIGGRYFAFGTPWSGSSNINVNNSAPVQAITFIERSSRNWIYSLSKAEALSSMLRHTQALNDMTYMDKLLVQFSDVIRTIPIYHMGCTISSGAVDMAYKKMRENRGEKACI